jgi:hypothetical protein
MVLHIITNVNNFPTNQSISENYRSVKLYLKLVVF